MTGLSSQLLSVMVFISLTDEGQYGSGRAMDCAADYYVTALKEYQQFIFASTYAGGIYRSSNEGVSWTEVDSGLAPILSLATNGVYLFAGILGSAVLRSRDTGNTWQGFSNGLTPIFRTLPSVRATFLPDRMGPEFFRSTDSGATWVNVINGLTTHICYAALASTGRLYL